MHLFFLRLSRLMALLGGIMLAALILLTCASVIGRTLNTLSHSDAFSAVPWLAEWLLAMGVGPINGDFELIEAGIAFSIFAFLPLCNLTGGHAAVDLFTQRLSDRSNRLLTLVTDTLFAAVLVLIAVQLYGGMLSKLNSNQTTLLLQFPVWWAYALSLTGAVVAAVVAVYVALIRVRETVTGQRILPADLGAGH